MCAQDCAALGLQRVVREKEEKDIKQRGRSRRERWICGC